MAKNRAAKKEPRRSCNRRGGEDARGTRLQDPRVDGGRELTWDKREGRGDARNRGIELKRIRAESRPDRLRDARRNVIAGVSGPGTEAEQSKQRLISTDSRVIPTRQRREKKKESEGKGGTRGRSGEGDLEGKDLVESKSINSKTLN